MLNRQYDTFLACDADYASAGLVLFGAPYDSTTSNRPGARFGPRAIRGESPALETYSPYQERDLTDIRVFDSGNLDLPFGDSEAALSAIEERTGIILEDGKLPVMLGGEHLVTLGAVRAAARKYTGLHIVHFDAHADLRDEYLGVSLSHACVIRRCWDILGDGRIAQYGIRSGDREEFEWAKNHVSQQKFNFDGLEQAVAAIKEQSKPVYLTIDLDVLDSSVFPGTGTPEAGGVTFLQLLGAIRTVCGARVVGCDITELAPPLDASGVSTATACKVVRELLLALAQ